MLKNEQRLDEIIEALLQLGGQMTRIYNERHEKAIDEELKELREELKSCLRKNK